MIHYISQLQQEYKERLNKASSQLSEARSILEDLVTDLESLWQEDYIAFDLVQEVMDYRDVVESVEGSIDGKITESPFCQFDSSARRAVRCAVSEPSAECPKNCVGRRKYA